MCVGTQVQMFPWKTLKMKTVNSSETWRNIPEGGIFKTSLFLVARVSECRRMEYKGGTEAIRLAVWARVLVFIHNLLALIRRIVCMFAAAWRKWYCLKQLWTAAFHQGNAQQTLPSFDDVETFHPVANILHSLPSCSAVSSFVLKTERFVQKLLKWNPQHFIPKQGQHVFWLLLTCP